jgi:hypothetical protein
LGGKSIRRTDYARHAQYLEEAIMSTALLEPVSKVPDAGQSAAAGWSRKITSSTATWVIETLAKLNEIGKLQAGWNSYGGRPLEPAVLEFTLRLMGWFEDDWLPTPRVVLGPRGTVQFEWESEGRELEVEILGTDSVAYLKMFPDGRTEEAELCNNLPNTLRKLTQWVLHG